LSATLRSARMASELATIGVARDRLHVVPNPVDVDGLRIGSQGVARLRSPELGVLIITHYTRILRYIQPDVVHVMFEGKIAQTGGPELAEHLEEKGYVEFGSHEPAAAPR
jgi:Fe-S cluster assembly ATP-binding protein